MWLICLVLLFWFCLPGMADWCMERGWELRSAACSWLWLLMLAGAIIAGGVQRCASMP